MKLANSLKIFDKMDRPSNKELDKAGNELKTNPKDTASYELINNWRSLHYVPLINFRSCLMQRLGRNKIRKKIIAQRLKRMPTIIDKLSRIDKMELSRMQDIGGVRIVFDTLENVSWLTKNLLKTGEAFKYKEIRRKDYIENPKKDGYRGVHIIYRYNNQSNEEYNKKYQDLQIEFQIRTKLQHLWATAVETIDIFTSQALKTGKGSDDWFAFFRLLSSFFAIKENTKKCEIDKDKNEKTIINEIREIEAKLKIKSTVHEIIQIISNNDKKLRQKRGGGYYILSLDKITKEVEIKHYNEKEIQKATDEYISLERDALETDKQRLYVLVSVSAFKNLRKAYPNYFLDIKDFLKELDEVLI